MTSALLELSGPSADVLAVLRASLPDITILIRRTRRSLVGLRRDQRRGLILRLHPELLIDADCTVSIREWVLRRGRGGAGRELRALLHRASTRLAIKAADVSDAWAASCPILGEGAEWGVILARHAHHIHQAWFADLPAAPVTWGRRPPGRRLSHLRFGCYRRTKRSIELCPRLARPWIAPVFLEHVLHHEYCHHRQAMTPLARRERMHSTRFRTWEGAFTGYADALRWERLALPWLLDDTPPPWYRLPRSSP